jgi:dTDP-4-dehydrorhamnose 3,5-epimerase
MDIIDFSVRTTALDGLLVLHAKQVSDERGTICEAFRRSAVSDAGIDIGELCQVNITTSRRGVVRGMHAEAMTKLTTVAAGEAYGMYVDLRPGSTTFGEVEQVTLRPGVEVLVPSGVANGFQTLSEPCAYLYYFDREWHAGMDGVACTPLDPALQPHWPLPIAHDDPAVLSAKDRRAPTIDELRRTLGETS